MPTVTIYLTEELYRELLTLAGGEKASVMARRLLEEKIREEIEKEHGGKRSDEVGSW